MVKLNVYILIGLTVLLLSSCSRILYRNYKVPVYYPIGTTEQVLPKDTTLNGIENDEWSLTKDFGNNKITIEHDLEFE